MAKAFKPQNIPEIILDCGLIHNFQDLIKRESTAIVFDTSTSELLPKSLFGEKNLKFIKLAAQALPLEFIAQDVAGMTSNSQIIAAFGSGSVTDICKYAAYIAGKEWISLPTAPSVNAYTSQNASLVNASGSKISKKAKAPSAVYVDLDVIKSAPKRLILSGLYDFLCAPVVHLDYFMSHILTGSIYNDWPFVATKWHKDELVQSFNFVLKKDKTLLKILTEGLLISGLGMLFCGSSKSASQAEHSIAHLLEVIHKDKFLHGECVAVGMLFSSKIQEKLFGKKVPQIKYECIEHYNQIKKSNSFVCIQEWNEKLQYWHEVFRCFTKYHKKLNKLILNSQIELPVIKNLSWLCKKYALNARNKNSCGFDLLLRDRFTCIDLALLCDTEFLY